MTMSRPGCRVVVGVDGSAAALGAVAVAATDAARRGCPLVVTTALSLPAMGAPVDRRMLGQIEHDRRDEADRAVAEAVAHARAAVPGVDVRTEVIVGPAVATLVRESAEADLVVLGSRGRGALSDLVTGSVVIQVVAQAQGPVLVVRGTARPDGPVVLGADGSAYGEAAVAFAFDEADRRGTALVAVRAWRHPGVLGPIHLLPVTEPEQESAQIQLLGESIRPWREKYPDVPVELRTVRGGAVSALVEASAWAQLVVVGARGHGGFAGLLLGSVGQGLIHHARCPVAVVRPAAHA